MYQPGTQLEVVLGRALRRAGIVQGYRHKCRKHGCGHVEASVDGDLRCCPKDNHKLWVTSLVRPIRFHDLRHTTGSLLTMRGANLHSVQRILRHSDPRTTAGTYLHLEPGYLRQEIDPPSFNPKGLLMPSPTSLPTALLAAKPPSDRRAASPESARLLHFAAGSRGRGGRTQ